MRFPILIAVSSLWFHASCTCGGAPTGDQPTSNVPPEKVTFSGTLKPAAGLSAADFDFFDDASDDPITVDASGSFSGTRRGRRTSVLFCVPREGTAAASKLAASGGLYMSPGLGTQHLSSAASGTGYELKSDGLVAMDAGTSVLTLLLQHPMLAHPWPGAQQLEVSWLLTQISKGLAPFDQAAAAYDAAIANGRDLSTDSAFTSALAALVAKVVSDMPNIGPPPPSAAEAGQALTAISFGYSSSNSLETQLTRVADDKKVTVTASNQVGTALDYYFEISKLSKADFPSGVESPPYQRVDHLRYLAPAGQVADGFVAARSYLSYVDVFNNAVTALSAYLGSKSIAPSSNVDLAPVEFYEVRFLSGAFPGGLPQAEADFVQAHYAPQASATFNHNVAVAVVEAFSAIPGSDALLGDTAGKAVIQAAITQVGLELEALYHTKTASQVTGDDVWGIVYNTSKAALDTFAQKMSEKPIETGWRKALSYLKWGGERALKTVVAIPGAIGKGGAAANRALRLARPKSLTEVYILAVGLEPPVRVPFSVDAVVNPELAIDGNVARVRIDGFAKTSGSFSATPGTAKCTDLGGGFYQCVLTVKVSSFASIESLTVQFTEPDQWWVKNKENEPFFEWRWKGYSKVRADFADADTGEWLHVTEGSASYSTSRAVSVPGADFTATASTFYRDDLVSGVETTHNYIVHIQ